MTIEFVIEVDWSEARFGQTPMAKQPDSIEAFLKKTLLHANMGLDYCARILLVSRLVIKPLSVEHCARLEARKYPFHVTTMLRSK
jgi:hypothetical protein